MGVEPRPPGYSPIPHRELAKGIGAAAVFAVAIYGAQYPFGGALVVGLLALLGLKLMLGSDATLAESFATEGMSAAQARDLVEKAAAEIERIDAANKDIPCPELSAMLDEVVGIGRDIIAAMRADPARIGRGRRFLETYPGGAARISEHYAKIHRHSRKQDLDAQYRDFLREMIDTFSAQREALAADRVLDMKLSIELMQRQLRSQGIA